MSDLDQPIRADILNSALRLTLGDRNESYGDPLRNLEDIATLWSAYLIAKFRGTTLDENTFQLSAEDVAHLNALQKIARTMRPAIHMDNYTDAVAYEAIAGECRLRESLE